jgi:hypothetical protein
VGLAVLAGGALGGVARSITDGMFSNILNIYLSKKDVLLILIFAYIFLTV